MHARDNAAQPDNAATVIIDEASGTIVMGANVRISTVAIAQGNLTIKVTETPQVSQPSPFSQTGTTEVVPRTNIQIDDSKGNKIAVPLLKITGRVKEIFKTSKGKYVVPAPIENRPVDFDFAAHHPAINLSCVCNSFAAESGRSHLFSFYFSAPPAAHTRLKR